MFLATLDGLGQWPHHERGLRSGALRNTLMCLGPLPLLSCCGLDLELPKPLCLAIVGHLARKEGSLRYGHSHLLWVGSHSCFWPSWGGFCAYLPLSPCRSQQSRAYGRLAQSCPTLWLWKAVVQGGV